MKKKSSTYAPRASQRFHTFLYYSFGAFLRRFFRISTAGLEALKGLESFVLIPTHQGNLDPFMIGSFIKRPVHWVTSDGNMRSRFMRFILQFVGSIPKSKNIPDIQTIGWIVDTIRKKKGIVGLFAEGQASWDGHTQKVMDGTGKLLKFLKVPVIVVLFNGSYYSQPRWGKGWRRGKMHIHFKCVFNPEELKALPHEEIQAKLAQEMEYDETEWQAQTSQRFVSPVRAEYLERALYLCPSCKTIASLRSKKDNFFCTACGYSVVLNSHYLFDICKADANSINKNEIFTTETNTNETNTNTDAKKYPNIRTIREWNVWQTETFPIVLNELIQEKKEKPLFIDTNTRLYRGWRTNPLVLLQTGTLALYADRIEHVSRHTTKQFFFKDIDGEGILRAQLFEFYDGKDLYQIRFEKKYQSARKWADCVTILRMNAID